MRHLHLAIVAAATCLAGVHCSAEPLEPAAAPPTATDEVEAVSSPAPPPRRDDPVGDRRDTVYGLRNGFTVTSTLRGEDGAFYSAGTFLGAVRIEGVTLVSKGEADVFLEKTNPDGSFAWAVAVGSAENESAPHVKTASEGQVTLLGMTGGRLDCGGGALPAWSSEAFFVCLFADEDGVNVGGGTFPTGEP